MGKTHRKVISSKKLSARARGIFVDRMPLSPVSVAVDSVGLTVLSCQFFKDVLCSFRKTEREYIMDKCLTCSEYERFIREMDEEDAAENREVEDVFKHPERHGYGFVGGK